MRSTRKDTRQYRSTLDIALWASIALAAVASLAFPRDPLPGESLAFLQGLLAVLALMGKGIAAAGSSVGGALGMGGGAGAAGAGAAGAGGLGAGAGAGGLGAMGAASYVPTGAMIGSSVAAPSAAGAAGAGGGGFLSGLGGALSGFGRGLMTPGGMQAAAASGVPQGTIQAAGPIAQQAATSPGLASGLGRAVQTVANTGNQWLGAAAGQPGGLIPMGGGGMGPFSGPGGVPSTPGIAGPVGARGAMAPGGSPVSLGPLVGDPGVGGPPSPGALERIARSGMDAVGVPPPQGPPPGQRAVASGLPMQQQIPLPERVGRGVNNALQTFVFGPDHRNLSVSDKAAILGQSVLSGMHKQRTGQGMGAIPYAQAQTRQLAFDRQMQTQIDRARTPEDRMRLEMLRQGMTPPGVLTQEEWLRRKRMEGRISAETAGAAARAQAEAYRDPAYLEAQEESRIRVLREGARAREAAKREFGTFRGASDRLRASDLQRRDTAVQLRGLRNAWRDLTPEQRRMEQVRNPEIGKLLFDPIPGESEAEFQAWANSLTGQGSAAAEQPAEPPGERWRRWDRNLGGILPFGEP